MEIAQPVAKRAQPVMKKAQPVMKRAQPVAGGAQPVTKKALIFFALGSDPVAMGWTAPFTGKDFSSEIVEK
jgi:hypothetical protein